MIKKHKNLQGTIDLIDLKKILERLICISIAFDRNELVKELELFQEYLDNITRQGVI